MPFLEVDKYKIIKYLYLPASQEGMVQDAMNLVQEKSEILVTEVQGILTELDDLTTLLSNERNSPNGALIKADVLEWEGGKRTEGMKESRTELTTQLANLLGLEINRQTRMATTSIDIQVIL
jgi:hypothetical protein